MRLSRVPQCSEWWGGYCNHGNVLFPTWHRAYLLRLEEALQSIPGCEDVSLPYWNQLQLPVNGRPSTAGRPIIPEIFLKKEYTYKTLHGHKGHAVKNPLYQYKYQIDINDNLLSPAPGSDSHDYDRFLLKPKGKPTRRFPYSSLYDAANSYQTEAHNNLINNKRHAADKMLQENVSMWMQSTQTHADDGSIMFNGVREQYLSCLDAPNYTVFSNNSSAAQYNEDNFDQPGFKAVVPLETPHNGIHMAIGGFEVPGAPSRDTVPGANGDMAQPETASFDPIFFFHHCWLDMLFWEWQRRHNSREELLIEEEYAGTNSSDNLGGPTAGVAGNQWLNVESPLAPFKHKGTDISLTSQDVTNIEKLSPTLFAHKTSPSYTYALPTFPDQSSPPHRDVPHIAITNLSRATIAGSFIVSAWSVQKSEAHPFQETRKLVGVEPIFSRWHVAGCANCQTHLEVKAFFPLHHFAEGDLRSGRVTFEAKVHTHADREGSISVGHGMPGRGAPRLRVSGGVDLGMRIMGPRAHAP